MPNVNSGVERQIESIRRVLRQRGGADVPRQVRQPLQLARARVGERGPLVRAIASYMANGTPPKLG